MVEQFFMESQQIQDSVKVLVVDDEVNARTVLLDALSNLNYDVSEATTGEEAIQILTLDTFDLVILDLYMPGADGVDVLEAAQKIAPDTGFIILTGFASTDTAVAALRSGAYDYLQKPVTIEVLYRAVAHALEKQKTQQKQKNALQLLNQAIYSLQASQPNLAETNPLLEIPPLTIDEQNQQIFFNKNLLDLTPIQYKILLVLAKDANKILPYRELAYKTHGKMMDEVEGRSMLRTHVYRLIQKIDAHGRGHVQTVRSKGVVFYTNPDN